MPLSNPDTAKRPFVGCSLGGCPDCDSPPRGELSPTAGDRADRWRLSVGGEGLPLGGDRLAVGGDRRAFALFTWEELLALYRRVWDTF